MEIGTDHRPRHRHAGRGALGLPVAHGDHDDGERADRNDPRHPAVAPVPSEDKLFRLLLVGFVAQVAGRLVDLQWHVTHEEFEGAAEQVRAHWLIWLSTIFVIWVALAAIDTTRQRGHHRGYLIVLVANLSYAVVSVIHFSQHLDHREVDWAHLLLAINSIAAALGVLWVIMARMKTQPGDK